MTGIRMTEDEAIRQLGEVGKETDAERAHGTADAILLDFLRDQGFPAVAAAWDKACERVGFWYA